MGDITAAHFIGGMIGQAMLRSWYEDPQGNADRMQELADVVARAGEFPYSMVLNPAERDLLTGYAEWSESYDGPNPLIELEEGVVRPILEGRAGHGVRALDAACGTGRHAALLSGLGCATTGIDQSDPMLSVARAKAPLARFVTGDVRSMPFDTGEFDLGVISLALCHLADPTDAVIELGRVLAPGATLVIADPHPLGATIGGQAIYGGIAPGRDVTFVRNHHHSASTWLRAFRQAGLDVDDCLEVPFGEKQIATHVVAPLYPDAVRASMVGMHSLWVWTLRKRP